MTDAKSLVIPEGRVARILVGDEVIWITRKIITDEEMLVKNTGATLVENWNLTPKSSVGEENTSYFTFKWIPIEPGATYYSKGGSRSWFYDADKNAVSTLNLNSKSNTGSDVVHQFVVPDDVYYISISYSYSGNTADSVAINKSGLPMSYTALEYIETDGTQYIDTGFYPNQDTRVVCEFMYLDGTEVYGCRSSASVRNFSFRGTTSGWQVSYYNGYTTVPDVSSDTTDWHIADQNKNVFSLDGVVGVEFEYATFECTYPLAIGAIKAGSMYYGNGRFKSFQIYDNGTLVRDLIPCMNADGEAGMYDKVNSTFYGNAGSGTFITSE